MWKHLRGGDYRSLEGSDVMWLEGRRSWRVSRQLKPGRNEADHARLIGTQGEGDGRARQK